MKDKTASLIIRTADPDDPEEVEEIVRIEQICFPPHEACKPEIMRGRVRTVPDFFLIAEDPEKRTIAGFLNGIAVKEEHFRDAFFTDHSLHDPSGSTVMLAGLDIMPEYRRMGLARRLVREYALHVRKLGIRRLVLTCLPEKVEMYRKFGFRDLGIADSTWGNEVWHEMDIMTDSGSFVSPDERAEHAEITYRETKEFEAEDLKRLFLSVGWESGRYPERLVTAMRNSTHVISAWDKEKLVGLVRGLDDGVTVAFLHYLLVDPGYQGLHIGDELMKRILRYYEDLLYVKLMPSDPKTIPFYERFGFRSYDNYSALVIKHFG